MCTLSTHPALCHRYICTCVAACMPFFRIWPENLQVELARELRTEVLVKEESVLAKDTPCTRVVFVLSGKVRVVRVSACVYYAEDASKSHTFHSHVYTSPSLLHCAISLTCTLHLAVVRPDALQRQQRQRANTHSKLIGLTSPTSQLSVLTPSNDSNNKE